MKQCLSAELEDPTDVVDVLVVGLGPVGATLAALLANHGIRVLGVEPSERVYALPRAAHIDHEVMRIFQSLGLAEAMAPHLRAAPDYHFLTADGRPLRLIEREGVQGISGWPVSFNIYQPGIEEVLRGALETAVSVTTLYGARFDAIVENEPDGIVARIALPGGDRLVRSQFLVGCDGSWSPVREALGIPLDDYSFDEPWLVLDARTNDESGFPRANLQMCDPERPTSFVHMGPGRLRWEFMLKPGEDPPTMLAPAGITALLRPWASQGVIEVERSAVYRFHGLVAERWREGRVFLAGDAAHQMPPFMGQGMCSGLRDAANLAWKLARVISRGGNYGEEPLLDSYQAERDPHVRHVIERAIEMGRWVCTLDPDEAAERDAALMPDATGHAPPALPSLQAGWLLDGSPGAGEIFPQPVTPAGRLDDLLGSGAWLIVRAETTERGDDELRCVRLDRDLPSPLAEPLRLWLEARGAEAVLVRPDRYVFGTGRPEDLVAAFERQSMVA